MKELRQLQRDYSALVAHSENQARQWCDEVEKVAEALKLLEIAGRYLGTICDDNFSERRRAFLALKKPIHDLPPCPRYL